MLFLQEMPFLFFFHMFEVTHFDSFKKEEFSQREKFELHFIKQFTPETLRRLSVVRKVEKFYELFSIFNVSNAKISVWGPLIDSVLFEFTLSNDFKIDLCIYMYIVCWKKSSHRFADLKCC